MTSISVYIICHLRGETPIQPVKIGISSDPFKRAASFRTANPNELGVLAHIACKSREAALAMESIFHTTYAHKRLCGEWFAIEPADALDALCACFRETFPSVHGTSVDELGELERKLRNWQRSLVRHQNDNEVPICQ